MNDKSDLTPNELFEEFDKAQNDVDVGKNALTRFSAVKDKSAFVEKTIKFLREQKEPKKDHDRVRSWGPNVLEIIGGEKAFRFLNDLLKEEKTKELKRGYRFTRFFTLRAINKLASSDSEREELRTLLEQLWQDEDEDYLIRAEAAILLVQQRKSDPMKWLKEMLGKFREDDYWAPARALRALREFPLPDLTDDIISVMRDSMYIDHKYDAIDVLGYYTNNVKVVHALGDVVITGRNRYLRLKAVKSLARLKNTEAEEGLVKALQDQDAEIREQASEALESLLSKEEAVSTIVQHALRERYVFKWDEIPGNDRDRFIEFLIENFDVGWVRTAKIEKIDDGNTINVSTGNNNLSLRLSNEKIKATLTIDDGRTDEFVVKIENGRLKIYREKKEQFLTYMTDAIRHIDPDRTLSTEILSKELGGEDRRRSEIAEKILAELGGWAAIQRLSQRRSTLKSLDDLLAKQEESVKSTFESTIRQARTNFKFAMCINIIVVLIGIVLIALAISQFVQKPDKLETWIAPGGAGTVLIKLVFDTPRKNARSDLAVLVDVNVIFLGFLRQINEIDATFKHAYLERDFGTTQMGETIKQIENTVAHTLNKLHDHILQQKSETSKGKDDSQEQSIKKVQ